MQHVDDLSIVVFSNSECKRKRNDGMAVLQVLQAKDDPYSVLGATQAMSKEQIHFCYRKRSLQCHPDKNTHLRATEAMQLVNAAWAFLKHEEFREAYDRKRKRRQKKQAQ